MSQFRTTLRNRVDAVAQAIADARRAGDSYTVSLHQARLEDLLDLAARNDIDTTGWTAPTTGTPTADRDSS